MAMSLVAFSLGRLDPLGGIMDWRAEISLQGYRRKEATAAGRAQVASCASVVGLAFGTPSRNNNASGFGGRPSSTHKKARAANPEARRAAKAAKAKAKAKTKAKVKAKVKAKAGESIESRVARLSSAGDGSRRGRYPESRGASDPEFMGSGAEGGKQRPGKKKAKWRNDTDQSPGRTAKRGRWNTEEQ
jgi:hypothetical protein